MGWIGPEKQFVSPWNRCAVQCLTDCPPDDAVLPLMGFCRDPPMLITDLMEANLRKYLSARSWDPLLGKRLLRDVAAGMAYLHAHSIVHGDLKSLNILVDGGRAVIADFGLSRVRQRMATGSGLSTVGTGGIAGTLAFVAPEVLQGQLPREPADVYSFGMVCYEVMSGGRYPFEDQPNVASIIYKVAILGERPSRPNGVDDGSWALMNSCWEQDPGKRPSFATIRDWFERSL